MEMEKRSNGYMAHCSLFMYGEKLQSNAGWISFLRNAIFEIDNLCYNVIKVIVDFGTNALE